MSSVPLFAQGSGDGWDSGQGYENFQGFDSSSYGGSNQYMSYPSTGNPYSSSSSAYPPGVVPPQSGYSTPQQSGGAGTGQPNLPYLAGQDQTIGGVNKIGGGNRTDPTLDPALTQELSQYLSSQVGQGVQPFDLSAILPSTGQATTPGTLTAPLNPLMQQLMQFFQGQSPGVTGTAGSTPGSTSGSPLSYILPMWQSEVSAMNQPIQQQYTNISEQMGALGLGGSSAEANALANYGEQTSASEQSLLGNLTLQALPQEESMASGLQTIDQSSITNLLSQFELTQPQNNPLLNMEYGLSTTFPPTYKSSGGGTIAGILGGLGDLAEGIGAGVAGV